MASSITGMSLIAEGRLITSGSSGTISQKKEIYRATEDCHFMAYFSSYERPGTINVYLNDASLFNVRYTNTTYAACCGIQYPTVPKCLQRVKTVCAMPASSTYTDVYQILDIYLKEGEYISAAGATGFSYYVYDRLEI